MLRLDYSFTARVASVSSPEFIHDCETGKTVPSPDPYTRPEEGAW